MPKINQEEYALKPSNKEEYDWLMEYLEENTDYKWNYDGVSLKPTKFKGDKDFIASDFIIIEKDEIWKTSYPKSGSTLVIVTDLIQGKFDMNLESEETEVKKDKEWLLDEIERITDEYSNQSFFTNYARYMISEIEEAVYQLDEPEVLTQEWIDEHVDYADVRGGTQAFIHVDDLQNLLVPKQEVLTDEQIARKVDQAYKDGYETGKQHATEKQSEETETVARVFVDYLIASAKLKLALKMEVEELEE